MIRGFKASEGGLVFKEVEVGWEFRGKDWVNNTVIVGFVNF